MLSSPLGHSFPQAVCMFGKSELIKAEYYVYQRHSSFPTYEYGRADVQLRAQHFHVDEWG